MRILLVEDDPGVALTLSALLECEGFEVVVSDSCAAARNVVAQDASFRAVLVDQHLEDGEGLSLVPTLRQTCQGATLLLLTGLPEAHREEKTVDGVFGKVDSIVHLLERLKQIASSE